MATNTHQVNHLGSAFKGRLLEVRLCNRGQGLYQHLSELITNHADADSIWLALQDYFFHRNGVYSKNGSLVIAPCSECRFLGIDISH